MLIREQVIHTVIKFCDLFQSCAGLKSYHLFLYNLPCHFLKVFMLGDDTTSAGSPFQLVTTLHQNEVWRRWELTLSYQSQGGDKLATPHLWSSIVGSKYLFSSPLIKYYFIYTERNHTLPYSLTVTVTVYSLFTLLTESLQFDYSFFTACPDSHRPMTGQGVMIKWSMHYSMCWFFWQHKPLWNAADFVNALPDRMIASQGLKIKLSDHLDSVWMGRSHNPSATDQLLSSSTAGW